jgi:hypothetical protein
VFLALLCIALAMGTLAGHPTRLTVVLEAWFHAVGAGSFSRPLSVGVLVVFGVALGISAPILAPGPGQDVEDEGQG